MAIVRAENQPSIMHLAQTIGRYWGSNDMSGFISLFTPNAVIIHPFFKEQISPKIAADVMNTTVCGKTTYRGFVLLKGEGDGKNDTIEMYFDETGEAANYKPSYIGRMAVQAEIVSHKFTKLLVHGYELIEQFPTRESPLRRINIGSLNLKEINESIAKAWETNDVETFVSLFAEDGLIMHPLFKSPITPKIAADVLNSAMRGTTIPLDLRLITGDGSGEFDVANMYFYETGLECGYKPDMAGIMHVTAKIINHGIKELYVHGYTAVSASTFERTSLLLKSSVEEKIFWSDKPNLEKIATDLIEERLDEA